MHARSIRLLLIASLSFIALIASAQSNPCANIDTGQGANLHGFVPFPSNSLWNTNIASAPLDPNSDAIINFIGGGVSVHPDFGSGLYNGQSIGIPYIVAPAIQPVANIHFTAYGDESDPGPMPIPTNAPIEGYPNPGDGDRHVVVIDKGNCWLYELDRAFPHGPVLWYADSAAVWDLEGNEQRPYTWTSADAAGLPIFPGLVRYDEVASGHINHAIRITLQHSKQAFTPPASHWASNSSNQYAAPMGMRLRLKAGFDISSYPAEDQVILTALKQYGAIMADNGSSMYLSGAPDDHWNNDNLGLLRQVTASDFEVLLISPLYTPQNIPTGPTPTISSFTSSASRGTGWPVTLRWSVSNGEYYSVSPTVGALRGTSIVVFPRTTTTYTLTATNPYNSSTAQVTVTVP